MASMLIRALVAGLAALAALGGGAARATVVERGTFGESYAFDFDDCGFVLAVDGRVGGRYRIRAGTGADEGVFFLRTTYSYRETLVDPATGAWFLLRGSGTFNEVEATRVEGSVFEVRSIEAGQPFVIEDSDGRVVLRDRGVIRRWALFDTGGDDEPGGTDLGLLDFELGGPHPAFFVDFCEVAAALTGA